jgi:CRISPR/Cas system-associated protein Cas7 (RAMP superfamily)
LDRSNIILVLIIGMGLYTLIQSIPFALNDLYEIFRDKIAAEFVKEERPKRGILAVELLRVTIGAFLIYAAPSLTKFINKNIAVRLDSK